MHIKSLQEKEGARVMVYSDLALLNECIAAFADEEGITVGSPDTNLVQTVPVIPEVD